jgi:hypothetical protein
VVTSVTRSPPKRERESHIPDLSNSNNESSKDNSEATLAEFDLRSLEHDLSDNVNTLDDKKKLPQEKTTTSREILCMILIAFSMGC